MNVDPCFKVEVTCPCTAPSCPKVATQLAKGTGHIKACPDSCAVCRGKRNRRRGLAKQAKARRLLGVPDAKQTTALTQEEFWRGTVRAEVKSGGQVRPIATAFLNCERQSEASRPHGDNRPFVSIAMPKGMSDGLVTFRLSKAPEVVAALYEQLGGAA